MGRALFTGLPTLDTRHDSQRTSQGVFVGTSLLSPGDALVMAFRPRGLVLTGTLR